jgi:hemoglobin
MIHKHREMVTGPEHRERWLQAMRKAADAESLPSDPEFRSALMAYFEWGTRMNDVFHDGVPVPKHAPMPIWGWGERKPYIPPQPE